MRERTPGAPALTTRQWEVLRLIACGLTAEQIGGELGISARTARAHTDVLKSKLGARRSRELPFAYRRLTGTDPADPAADGGHAAWQELLARRLAQA
jgi:DNA-binding NarL/FixJ family response regulator